jgi:adenosine kinase
MSHPTPIICGSIAIDRIMNFSGRYRDLIQPDKLHVLSLSVLVDSLEETPGGIGANIASCLAQLGERPVLLGAIGKEATEYVAELGKLGVDVTQVHHSRLPTASFSVMTDSDDNQVGGFYPGAMADAAKLSLAPWAGQDAFVVLGAHDPAAMRRQVEECQRHNLRLMYDPGQQVSSNPGQDLAAGVAAAEVLVVNDYELGVLCQRAGTTPAKLKASLPVMITTLGKDGSVVAGSQLAKPLTIGIAAPDKVADPTGAGDAYRAGFLYGYLRQWDLRICGQLGAVMASFIVERRGTQHQFSRTAIQERYRHNFNEELLF